MEDSDDTPESGEFKTPHLEERFADGGNQGRTDGLTGIAGCLLVLLAVLFIIGIVVLVVRLSGI